MWKKLAMLVIASGVAAKVWRMWQEQQHAGSSKGHKREHATSVQRWEEEGGTPTVARSAARPQGSADGDTGDMDRRPATRRRARKPAAPRPTVGEVG